MEKLAQRLESLIDRGSAYFRLAEELELNRKISPEKWSKKEILGHLIDSGIHNLQRFTEIQYEPKPYPVLPYRQVELVNANHYQEASVEELTVFWQAVNRRIQAVMLQQTDQTLSFPIVLGNGASADLAFLVRDYVDHLEHHLRQVFDPLYPSDHLLSIPKLNA